MKNSTSSSSDSTVTSASLARAPFGIELTSGVFGSAASFVASSSGAPPIAVSLAAAPVSSSGRLLRRGATVRDDHRPLDAVDVLVARRQRAELAGGDEVEVDAVMARVAAGAVLDHQAVRLVLFVRLHAGARPPASAAHRRAPATRSAILEERLVVRVAARAAP